MKDAMDPTWAALGRQAIDGPSRGGANARMDPDYETLQAQVRQALSASTAPADWEKVVHLAAGLLKTKSKDLLVAAYCAVGLIHTHQIEGFMIGCTLYLDLLETFWAEAFPEIDKPKARGRAISWWIERSAAALRTLEHLPVRRDEMAALLERCRTLAALTRERLPEAPSWGLLTEQLEHFAQGPASPAAAGAPERKVVLQPAAGETISSDEDAKRAQAALANLANRLSTYWQSRELSDPLGYRLSRLASWFSIQALPPTIDGRTRIAAPESRLIEQLSALRSGNLWEPLVRFTESALGQSIFWLDLQRAAVEALDALGERFAGAADAVRRDTGSFLARLPGLAGLSFADGTAFADDASRQWLAGLTPEPASKEPARAAAPESDLEAAIRKDVDGIKPLLKSRKYAEAARAFQERLTSAVSARERFLCRLAFAEALAKFASSAWFAPQAERILEDIDTYRLVEFDPDLALRGITRVLKGYQSQSDAISKKRSEELFRRLAQIDLTEFVRHGGAN